MQCLKCGREFPDKTTVCMYCGASLDQSDSSVTNVVLNEKRNMTITDQQNEEQQHEQV
jgi:hypothetical protein